MDARIALAAALAVALTGASHASASADGFDAAHGGRPHARVVTYAHGVRVTRLQLQLHRSGELLRGRVLLDAQSTTGHALTRELRVGRCVARTRAEPICPAALRVRVRIPASGSVTLTRSVTLRQPPPRFDAVEAKLVARGAPARQFHYRADAELLLRGRAWRGATAGRVYGVFLRSGTDAQVDRINVDGPAVSPTALYADVVYTFSGSALTTPPVTTLLRSPADGDDATVLKNRRPHGPQSFGDRFDVRRQGATAFGIEVRGADQLLARALLPWPA